MNCVVEKWLTIAALTGWIGSMGSMMVLAVSAPSVNPAISASQRFAAHNTSGLSISRQVTLAPLDHTTLTEPKFLDQSTIQSADLPLDPVYRHWLDQSSPQPEKY
ncbi:hypothetical protein [Myxacorys almedinensis]|uniref:Uncharacterized protein n=1 Tax=Myxacorys almedinensis A TaxID=2690445 RepID=A0A8J7YZS4_9CYAN|nr:hypothetical protein [Myxacorys almedinensis]NDJ17549.1 hypothetical protein [Myxacorys almedinensis A]